MPQPCCLECRNVDVVRTRRRGLLERCYSLFGIYPFRCQRCGHRFRVRQRGVRYLKTYTL